MSESIAIIARRSTNPLLQALRTGFRSRSETMPLIALSQQIAELDAKLGNLQRTADNLPAAVTEVVKKEFDAFKIPEAIIIGDQLYQSGAGMPSIFPVNPAEVPYDELRAWVHSFVNWIHDMHHVTEHGIWVALHNDASTALNWNIDYHFKSFKKQFSSKLSRLDMLYAKGNFREWAKCVYRLYGDGSSIVFKETTHAPARLDWVPVLEKQGTVFEANLPTECAGRRKGKQTAAGAQAEQTATAAVEAAKKDTPVASIPDQFLPEAIVAGQSADPHEAALKVLPTAVSSVEKVSEPWTQAVQQTTQVS